MDTQRGRRGHWLAGVTGEGQSGRRFATPVVTRFESFKPLSPPWRCGDVIYWNSWSSLLQTLFSGFQLIADVQNLLEQ